MGMGSLTGKTALVTGGSRGIGRAAAERLAKEGALVAVHYGRNEAAAEEVVKAIRAEGGAAFAVKAELGVHGDAETLWSEFDRQALDHGAAAGLDILVNNAGVAPRASIEETTREVFDEVFAVNVRAPFFLTQQGLKRLRDGGRIINVSSGTARIAVPDALAYSMTKGAVEILTRTLAQAVGSRGITVNAVSPGITDTDMTAGMLHGDPAGARMAADMSALGRVGQPGDVADVIAFLASDASRWVTGQVVDASGGSRL
ncbi:SDR family oxidoreductase [Streptomyces sp. NA04227]|uniref:SDR family oxidoreductase n=1 Tax=Streptomyces sp. NA04227 TaxID=2742136 RepID=UPI0015911756|nr:SDR family oxidoreductase [Streptomyces sp. NA04227]QKW08480.1 SDR family oxidoreductase [Streptomyces sp. NA04227]